MSPENLPPAEPSATPTEISRRKLLKMLAIAGAGASTIVVLSDQWVKPIAAGGKLAPHAQTSQAITRTIISGSAWEAAIPAPEAIELFAECQISPIDPNIPISATVSAATTTVAPATTQTIIGTQTANTNASGVASYDFNAFGFNPPLGCGPTTLTVVFSFASPSDGSGTYSTTTPWQQPC